MRIGISGQEIQEDKMGSMKEAQAAKCDGVHTNVGPVHYLVIAQYRRLLNQAASVGKSIGLDARNGISEPAKAKVGKAILRLLKECEENPHRVLATGGYTGGHPVHKPTSIPRIR